jgi:hypothetical protein
VTLPLPFRRVSPPRPRRRIVAVGNYWRTAGPETGREVLVREPGGQLVTRFLPDDHPALVRFLERAAVAA